MEEFKVNRIFIESAWLFAYFGTAENIGAFSTSLMKQSIFMYDFMQGSIAPLQKGIRERKK